MDLGNEVGSHFGSKIKNIERIATVLAAYNGLILINCYVEKCICNSMLRLGYAYYFF